MCADIDNRLCFQKSEELFREYCIVLVKDSPEYSQIALRLDSILILADRVLSAFSETMDFGRVINIANKLHAILDAKANNSNYHALAEDLLREQEIWLKSLLSLVAPSTWEAKSSQKNFTLAPVFESLQLLSNSEIAVDINDYDKRIADPARQLLLLSYRFRNPLSHSPHDWSNPIKDKFLSAALFTLIAPLYKHYDLIRNMLKGLITSSTLSPEIQDLLRMLESERKSHINHFAARQNWIADLQSRLEGDLRKSGKYVLVTGIEGMGKSAISATMTEVLNHGIVTIGAAAPQVLRLAPWLPNSLLHFGKKSHLISEIVNSLIEQANTMLLNPVSVPDPNDLVNIHISLNAEMDDLPAHSIAQRKQRSQLQKISEDAYDVETSYFGFGQREMPSKTIMQHNQRHHISSQYQRVIYLALQRLVDERGPIVLIVDALDEISPDGRSLEFLPDHLPNGVSGLLTARKGTDAVKWLRVNRNIDVLALPPLEKSEISGLTGVSDDTESHRAFNERVWVKSRGWPVSVLAAATSVRDHNNDLNAAIVYDSDRSVLERQANQWIENENVPNATALYDILLLLTLFEPVMPLELDAIQSYLESLGFSIDSNRLRQLLQVVESQIEGIDVRRVKLGLKAFGDYVREVHCTNKDIRRALARIVSWLANDEAANARLLASFLHYWTDSKQIQNNNYRTEAAKLVDHLKTRNDGDLLYRIARHSLGQGPRQDLALEFASECLRLSAELGNLDAMVEFGSRLIDGNRLPKDSVIGEQWLTKAANAGHAKAMLQLGARLLDGNGLDVSLQMAQSWLRRAILAGSEDAQIILGTRFLDRQELSQDPAEGEILLREVAEKNNSEAKLILANRLLDGIGILTNQLEGEKILQDLVELGDKTATRLYATRLISGVGLPRNQDEGERILNNLAYEGDINSAIMLGERLIDGYGLAMNVAQGTQWLRKAIVMGSRRALVLLGSRFLEGRGVPIDLQEGQSLLEKAINLGSASAMRQLGIYLIDGKQLPKDSRRGQTLLINAANNGDTKAMVILAIKLLEGDGIPKRPKQGEEWLQKAVQARDMTAIRIYGNRLINGDGFSIDVRKGEALLRQAASQGNVGAMRDLGQRLCEGDQLAANEKDGVEWFEKAIRAGDVQAMAALGTRLLDGTTVTKDTLKGEALLRRAANLGDGQAMRVLGYRLLLGEAITQNTDEAMIWLYKAIDEGDDNTTYTLARRLFSGNGVTKNSTAAESLLRRAIDLGDAYAMYMLGTRQIDGEELLVNIREGEELLRRSAKTGNLTATMDLGARLLDGKGLQKNIREGRALLEKASGTGDPDAMYALGSRLVDGNGFDRNSTEGTRLLTKAYENGSANAGSSLGRIYYSKGDYEAATKILLETYKKENKVAANNLAYMIRRSEISANTQTPPIIEMLSPLVEDRDFHGLINRALCLGKGIQCEVDWYAADELVALTRESKLSEKEMLNWWYDELRMKNDLEGHLVVGWLVRHGLLKDPDKMSIADRMSLARKGNWDIPDWMDLPA